KNFEKKVILGKVPTLKLTTTEQVPGDVLYYDVEVDYIHDEGSMVSVSVMKNNKQIGTGTLVFAHLGEGFESKELYGPEDLQDLIRGFGVYDVGVDADGNPLVDPRTLKK
ncbi:MAG: hypothetical protein IJG83_01900, partial [Thermoguttaceae bacterium]|nr:hypothetical protein [Thermoguttaceae bacterium]